jgi:hypothetical protein
MRAFECRRNRSGQSILEHFRTTAFNKVAKVAATHPIKSSYFLSISVCFNKSLKLVRDPGIGQNLSTHDTRRLLSKPAASFPSSWAYCRQPVSFDFDNTAPQVLIT